MKNSLLLIFCIFITTSVISQSPSKFSYQALIRDTEQNLVTNSIVGIKMSLVIENIMGPIVYEESFTSPTNINGLLSIEIGGGPGFDTINWGNGPYFLKSEVDPSGGTNYSISGITQLLSVPYALHARSAKSIRGGHYVGEFFGGGLVFWVTPDRNHGLIVSLDDIDDGTGAPWGLYGVDVPNCESMTDGESNTNEIILAGCEITDAAGLCNSYTAGGYNGWYLPSAREFYLLFSQDILIDYLLDNDEDPNTNGFYQERDPDSFRHRYWTSSENSWSPESAESLSTYPTVFIGSADKYTKYRVKAIRAF